LLVLLLGSVKLEERVVSGGLSPSGTPVALDTGRPFDRLQVVIRQEDVQGVYEGQPGPAIAEIEVTARAAESSGPLAFLRGDANSDALLQISDSIAILDWLFSGGTPVRCQAAADPDGNSEVNLTDAIYLLNHLFLGGSEPVSPFPACGAGTSSLSCDGPTACGSG